MATTDRMRLRYPTVTDPRTFGEDVARLAVDVDRYPKWRVAVSPQQRAGDIIMGTTAALDEDSQPL